MFRLCCFIMMHCNYNLSGNIFVVFQKRHPLFHIDMKERVVRQHLVQLVVESVHVSVQPVQLLVELLLGRGTVLP